MARSNEARAPRALRERGAPPLVVGQQDGQLPLETAGAAQRLVEGVRPIRRRDGQHALLLDHPVT